MSDERSILQQLGDAGSPVPRVRLPGEDAGTAGVPATERYEIVGEMARGGASVVYKGRDTDLGRDVAMKVLREEHLHSPERVQRFVEEAQIGGQLQHPGIVPVYELGVREKTRPYFAMRLVKGRTLTELLSARASPSEGRHALLAHFAQACHTVAYAHSRGVIHRDLKPGNVMVGSFGDVQVVDWGFARLIESAGTDGEGAARPGVTVISTVGSASGGAASPAGTVLGTPAYMPPEQALGHVDTLTERADVFSLGAILCEILTGKPPYVGEPPAVLAAAVKSRLEDAFGRLDGCGADAELVSLSKACLRPLPKDRPRSARDVAEALSVHLSGAERRAHAARVRAVEEQVGVQEQRRARRQTLVIAASVLLVVSLAGGALLAKSSVDATRARERTSAFDAAVREATRLQASADDWPAARSAADRAAGLAGSDPQRRRETDELRAGIETAAASADRAAARAKREASLLAALDEIVLRRGDRFDTRKADDEYATALPDLDALHDFDRKVELAAHLDQWAWLRRKLGDRDGRPLDALARTLDPDAWRSGLREAATVGDMGRLRTLAIDPATATQGPRSLDMLGTVLGEGGDEEAAAKLLARAAERYPGDFWIQVHLGRFAGRWDTASSRYANPGAAIEHFTAAVALRPTSAGAHDNIGIALWSKGDLDGSIDAYRRALRLDAGSAAAHQHIGVSLRDKRDFDGAVSALREALRLDPSSACVHAALGSTLEAKGDLDGAIEAFREALRLDPREALTHNSLAAALGRKGDLDGALAACREAIRLDPTLALARINLGFALSGMGDADGAISSFREAIRLDPNSALACTNLGLALAQKGDAQGALDAFRGSLRVAPNAAVLYNIGNLLWGKGELSAAIWSYRDALGLDPNLATAHTNLGNALQTIGDLSGAIASYHEAIRADPKLALAHAHLGDALGIRGDLLGSVESLHRAAALDPQLPGIRSAIAAAERLAAAQARVPAVLQGADRPQSAEEWQTLAEVAYRTKNYVASGRWWKEAFDSDPRLAADLRASHRYDAACAAALAGPEWHGQALEWLRADLRAWRELPESEAKTVAGVLRHWKADRDFADVRDAEALSDAWRALWADVDALLARVEKPAGVR